MKRAKRWVSLLLAMCLAASLLPAGAVAEEGEQEGSSTAALNLGAGVIAEGDTVYFGTYDNSTVSWKVLSTEGNGDTYKDSEDEDYNGSALFLLSDTAWYTTAFNDEFDDGNNYTNSKLQSSLLVAAQDKNYFSELEQTAILQTSKDAGENTTFTLKSASLEDYTLTYINPELDNDTLFALSAAELVDYLGYKDILDSSGLDIFENRWWLRSAVFDNSNYVGVVHESDLPFYVNLNYEYVWARPAFNLNMNSVLFTSAAEGGKNGTEGVSGLQSVSTNASGAWKLTLKDSKRGFAISTIEVNESTLTVSYINATIGDNEYISAIVVDDDNDITYYGRIKNTTSGDDASGEVTITLPAGFNASTDTLYLFSEQYNGDKNTDYASELQEVSIDDGSDTTKSGWTRLAGDDRYATMAAVVQEAFGDGSSDYVVIASGQNFADSLAASSLAGVLDAPVILVSANTLSTDAATQIERVGATYAYIVGGTSSVSDSVYTSVRNLVESGSVTRLSGDDRYATAVEVAKETVSILRGQGQELQSIILASGTVYADALSISPYAYTTASPIILVGSNGLLGDTALDWIDSSGATSLIVAGGTSSVADSAITQTGISEYERLAGSNRYETSVEIAEWAIEEGYLNANGAAIASGQNFPDALSSSALCGQFEIPLLLVSNALSTELENFLTANASLLTYGYIVGGTNTVSDAVAAAIAEASALAFND